MRIVVAAGDLGGTQIDDNDNARTSLNPMEKFYLQMLQYY